MKEIDPASRSEERAIRYEKCSREREGEREQPQDLEQAQHGQNYTCSKIKQMSTLRQFKGLGVKLSPAVSITNMSNSVRGGESCGLKEGKIPTAAAQPGKTLGPGKSKQSKLRQEEEWSSIPDSCFIKSLLTPQASEEGGPSSPLSVHPVNSLSNKSTQDPRKKVRGNKDEKWKLNKLTGSRNYELPPTSVDPCAKIRAPPHPSQGEGDAPNPSIATLGGGSGCKGGGEEAQGDLKHIQAKIRK